MLSYTCFCLDYFSFILHHWFWDVHGGLNTSCLNVIEIARIQTAVLPSSQEVVLTPPTVLLVILAFDHQRSHRVSSRIAPIVHLVKNSDCHVSLSFEFPPIKLLLPLVVDTESTHSLGHRRQLIILMNLKAQFSPPLLDFLLIWFLNWLQFSYPNGILDAKKWHVLSSRIVVLL